MNRDLDLLLLLFQIHRNRSCESNATYSSTVRELAHALCNTEQRYILTFVRLAEYLAC